MGALFGEEAADASGDGGGDGAHVDDDGVVLDAVNDAVIAEDDFFDVGGVGDHDDDYGGLLGDFPGGVGDGGAFGGGFGGLAAGAVVDGEGVAGLDEVEAHGEAHDAESDESDGGFVGHCVSFRGGVGVGVNVPKMGGCVNVGGDWEGRGGDGFPPARE